MELSPTPDLSLNRRSNWIPSEKESWLSRNGSQLFGIFSFSMIASVACHIAILCILLFENPTPKDLQDLVSVEIISSELVGSTRKFTIKEYTSSGNDVKVASPEGPDEREITVAKIPSVEIKQKYAQTIGLNDFNSTPAAVPSKKSKALRSKKIQFYDNKPVYPWNSKLALMTRSEPKAIIASRHSDLDETDNLLFEDQVSTGTLITKTYQKIPEMVRSIIIVENFQKKENVRSMLPTFLKWKPTKKPTPPKTVEKIPEFNKIPISFKPGNPNAKNSNRKPAKNILTAKSILKVPTPPKKKISILTSNQLQENPQLYREKERNFEQISGEINKKDFPNSLAEVDEITIKKSLLKHDELTGTDNSRRQLTALKPVKPISHDAQQIEKNTSLSNEGDAAATPKKGNPRPYYPARAVRKKWEGRVVLLAEVLPSGEVGTLKTALSSGHWLLDQAAIRAVRQWNFSPAKLAGVSVSSHVQIPVQFKLR